MEITVDLFNEAVLLSKPVLPEIESYFNRWSEYTPEQILAGKVKDEHHNSAWSIIEQVKHRISNAPFRAAGIEELSGIITYLNQKIKSAFINKDFKDLLCVVSINASLKLPFRFLLNVNLITIEQSDALVEESKVMKGYFVQFNVPDDAPYYEKEYYAKYVEGIKELDIEKTYSIINAVENGRGIIVSYIAEGVFRFIYEIAPDTFIELLNMKTEPHDFIMYLQWMSKDELIGLSSFNISHSWGHFEIIRQLSRTKNTDDSDTRRKAIAEILRQSFVKSTDFYYQTLIYFEGANNISEAIGTHLATLESKDIEDVVLNCFTFNIYDIRIDAKTKLLEAFAKDISDLKIDAFLIAVHNKWIEFIDSLLVNREFYQSDLLLTDYANYIVHYLSRILPLESISSSINSLINRLNSINESWHYSEIQRTTHFFMLLSELNLYSYATRNIETFHVLVDEDKWREFYENKVLKSMFFYHAKFEVVESINANWIFS